MTHISITNGLDIPISGHPSGEPRPLAAPKTVALDLSPFRGVKFRLRCREGDTVKQGQPLVEDKSTEGRFFVSPATGTVKEIRRGLKRCLLSIVIDCADKEEPLTYPTIDLPKTSREELIKRLLEGGMFSRIHARPFERLADPHQLPRSIFVKAIESAPFIPAPTLQIANHENDFQTGLDALKKLTDGPVHLITRPYSPFLNFKNVEIHTAEGPHPISNLSIPIHIIDPIKKPTDVIWTLSAYDVVCLGHLLNTGHTYHDRIISIAGPGILPDRTGYFQVKEGYPIAALIADRIPHTPTRFISGDPLMGTKVTENDFLGFNAFAFTAIPENTNREFLHFFRPGSHKYTTSRAYLSGHLKKQPYPFTTNQHGEHRAFIDPSLYDAVMPLPVPTMQLVKAIQSDDFDLAEELGLLEVAPEDFALPTFVCPSKNEMVDIVQQGLAAHAAEVIV
ncbi:MAG: Na(+)-translocating NADH-quinone reductase subunit A [Chlamydiia bacterium]|nr:Na(+)-translocating NADH-quinone reductase subunit A [Chlamydiia bacterium]